jgi:hypothetical protein
MLITDLLRIPPIDAPLRQPLVKHSRPAPTKR